MGKKGYETAWRRRFRRDNVSLVSCMDAYMPNGVLFTIDRDYMYVHAGPAGIL